MLERDRTTHAQGLLIILGSIVNMFGETFMSIQGKENPLFSND